MYCTFSVAIRLYTSVIILHQHIATIYYSLYISLCSVNDTIFRGRYDIMLCLGGEIHEGTLVSVGGMGALGVEEGVTGRHAAVATVHAAAILHVVVELLPLVQEQVNVLLVMWHSSLLRVLRQHYVAFISSVLVGLQLWPSI